MGQLNDIKMDMDKLIRLSMEIGNLSTRLIYVSDLNDERNYDETRADKIKNVLTEKEAEYNRIYEKWF